MKHIIIEIASQTASFRNPDFQNFHKSLELPPPTTIVGMAGAALGLSPFQVQEWFIQNKVSLGVCGKYLGKCSDTWKYNRRTKEMWLYKSELDGSIIQKEFLIHNNFLITFSGEEKAIIQLLKAFSSPVYALTMGNSDSLAKVIGIEQIDTESETDEIEYAMIEGDVIDNVIRLAPENMEFTIYQTSEPIAFDLPVAFDYESDYGKRVVSKLKTFSIIGKKMKLNYSVKGIKYKDTFIPTINL